MAGANSEFKWPGDDAFREVSRAGAAAAGPPPEVAISVSIAVNQGYRSLVALARPALDQLGVAINDRFKLQIAEAKAGAVLRLMPAKTGSFQLVLMPGRRVDGAPERLAMHVGAALKGLSLAERALGEPERWRYLAGEPARLEIFLAGPAASAKVTVGNPRFPGMPDIEDSPAATVARKIHRAEPGLSPDQIRLRLREEQNENVSAAWVEAALEA